MFLILFLALSKFCVLDVTPSKQSICCFFRVQTLTAPDSWTLRDDELITIKHKRIRPAYMRARCINSASVLLQKHTVPVSPAAKNPSECDFCTIEILHPVRIRLCNLRKRKTGCSAECVHLIRRYHNLIVRARTARPAELTGKIRRLDFFDESLSPAH